MVLTVHHYNLLRGIVNEEEQHGIVMKIKKDAVVIGHPSDHSSWWTLRDSNP